MTRTRRMGRRKVYARRRRLTVYFCEAEYQALIARSEQTGIPMTQIARSATLNALRIEKTQPEND